MLTVTGKAEFANQGKMLQLETKILPAFENQFELLQEFASGMSNAVTKISVEAGHFVIRHTFHKKEEAETAPKALPEAASAVKK